MTNALVLASQFRSALALRCLLMARGFTVTVVASVKDARRLLGEARYELLLLDIHRLDENAFAFVRELRNNGSFLPVLYVGERSYRDALLLGTTGVDEFLLKPFARADFDQVISTILARIKGHGSTLLSGVSLDERGRRLWVKDKTVSLGKLETRIFSLLAERAGNVVSLERLQRLIEKEGVRFNRRTFYHVSGLRRKLENAGVRSLEINFVKDGYRLDVV